MVSDFMQQMVIKNVPGTKLALIIACISESFRVNVVKCIPVQIHWNLTSLQQPG